MNDAEINRLREAAWRRPLTAEESAHWAAALTSKQEGADARLETELGRRLRGLPPVPVPSNFTHRVMQAVAQDPRPTARTQPWTWLGWRRWLPKAAVASVLGLGLLAGWHQHQENQRRQLAASLQRFTALAVVPAASDQMNLEIWQNFDVIRRMSGMAADEELLTVAKAQE